MTLCEALLVALVAEGDTGTQRGRGLAQDSTPELQTLKAQHPRLGHFPVWRLKVTFSGQEWDEVVHPETMCANSPPLF